MTNRELTAVLAQLRPGSRDVAANLAVMRGVIFEHRDADLVVFPELFLSGYTTEEPGRLAIAPEGPEVEAATTRCSPPLASWRTACHTSTSTR